ncbi:MAPEG family protein [Sphingomonas sp.]|uniref:MAPEG family protein n=1 Tax=Sphingomonas sp. TaxID=28214 RepID=UPI003AFFFA86
MVLRLPEVTLVLAGLCALLNIWLGYRVGQVRRAAKVSVGDGGDERVIRRMRAHANFAENTPIVVLLVLALELSVGPSPWLWAAAALFVVARIGHALGMDGWSLGRSGGIGITFALQLALAVWAIALPLTVPHAGQPQDVTVPANG